MEVAAPETLEADTLNEGGRRLFGRGYRTVIAARLRVSDRHIDAWCNGSARVPDAPAASIRELFANQARADDLVERWLVRLGERAQEAGLSEADIHIALGRRTEIALACAALSAPSHRAARRG